MLPGSTVQAESSGFNSQRDYIHGSRAADDKNFLSAGTKKFKLLLLLISRETDFFAINIFFLHPLTSQPIEILQRT